MLPPLRPHATPSLATVSAAGATATHNVRVMVLLKRTAKAPNKDITRSVQAHALQFSASMVRAIMPCSVVVGTPTAAAQSPPNVSNAHWGSIA
mmetsp:Transcript_60482/g.134805  ORF Transcript_60482/g.134805 Transcript_60482/m.134805 type:complete len:93 (-) Transcript_60482:259-537(-)|eukprot:CAMPEP_0181237098 /NCGR_PEP_ID=MMETSP1096-20121128/38565_1 /TAXON_ID=156174 ORGANISM="Chrysochromulina ericina, Strain CCMP281" /NCGR_SAMPLE_ID=MMETSP1096 /ASSEMBLY_ACC=CAM_ASM_000453 /LENGTH=92 /DNA_ID=CAMNT_0023332397 /DNA_START=81 /DNA_END=359 /DNA_ORIENTATION=+